MIGAVIELSDDRKRNFMRGHVPWWVFYLVGAVFVIGFPLLINRGYRWFTGVLALLVAGKALYLFYGLSKSFVAFNLFFALVALVAACTLGATTAKNPPPPRLRSSEQ